MAGPPASRRAGFLAGFARLSVPRLFGEAVDPLQDAAGTTGEEYMAMLARRSLPKSVGCLRKFAEVI